MHASLLYTVQYILVEHCVAVLSLFIYSSTNHEPYWGGGGTAPLLGGGQCPLCPPAGYGPDTNVQYSIRVYLSGTRTTVLCLRYLYSHTQACSVHRHQGARALSGDRAMGVTVTGVPAIAFTFNINSTNENST